MRTTQTLQPTVDSDSESRTNGRILCIVSAKGGSGKTILAATLASLLVEAKKRVLTIDTDFSTRGLSLYLLNRLTQVADLEIQPENCLADSIMQDISPNRVAPSIVHDDRGIFEIILPNSNFRKGGIPDDAFLGEFSPEFENRYFAMLAKLCEKFRLVYDYIIIDTRGGYDYSSRIPAILADGYVVVLEADSISVQQVVGLLAKIDEHSRALSRSNLQTRSAAGSSAGGASATYGLASETSLEPRVTGRASGARHLGFIINKALFSTEAGEAFATSLTSLVGGNVFGIVPADRNAIRAYQHRDIPYQKFVGSDFSYHSFGALSHLLGIDWRESAQSVFGRIGRKIHRRWIVAKIMDKIEQLYPTTVLPLLLLAFAGFIAYQAGFGWATANRITSLVVLVIGWSVVAVLVGAVARFQEDRKKLLSVAIPSLIAPLAILAGVYSLTSVRHLLLNDARYSRIQQLTQEISAQDRKTRDIEQQLLQLQVATQSSKADADRARQDLDSSRQLVTQLQSNESTQLQTISKYKAQIDQLNQALTAANLKLAAYEARPPQSTNIPNRGQDQSPASRTEWQANVDWSIADTGAVDCPQLYEQAAPECITSGGRACLMRKAISYAFEGNYGQAMSLTLITQCHNSKAQASIKEAGPTALGDYLRSKAGISK